MIDEDGEILSSYRSLEEIKLLEVPLLTQVKIKMKRMWLKFELSSNTADSIKYNSQQNEIYARM